ncbi:hypothetical protein G5714_011200 [Onychostoma macrolepis]|uniref:Uncharacterized protein n=1 Tax=Onychostoma macrolepis TaxID=369639 RepID=A0A7J6CMN6_9TELE|nr:hypothetical protein G5714_011200 [Onychostoma macrolepis]
MTESKEKALSLKSDVTTVAVRNDVKETEKPKRKILDEDEYIENLEKIIQRTFSQMSPNFKRRRIIWRQRRMEIWSG